MAIVQTGSIEIHHKASTGPINGTTASGSMTGISIPADAQMTVLTFSGFYGGVNVAATGTFAIGANQSIGVGGGGGGWSAALHYILLPATGTQTITWQWGGGTGTALSEDEVFVIISHWKGIDTGSPTRSSGGNQGSADNAITPSLTAQTGDLIIACGGSFDGGNADITYTWATGTITLTELQGVTNRTYSDTSLATGSPSGNGTVGCTGTGIDECGVAAWVFKAASVASDLAALIGEPITGYSALN